MWLRHTVGGAARREEGWEAGVVAQALESEWTFPDGWRHIRHSFTPAGHARLAAQATILVAT